MEKLTHSEIQEEEFRILTVFDSFCKEYELKYSLYAGTLLGSVRHGGFIPWDDDIDVCMARPEYDRLLTLGDMLPGDFRLITKSNSAFALPFAKIQFMKIRAQERAYDGLLDEYLWIDVFPMDKVPESTDRHAQLRKKVRSLIKRRTWLICNFENDSFFKRTVKRAYRLTRNRKRTIARIDREIDSLVDYSGYSDAVKVSCLLSGGGQVWAVSREGFENSVDVAFEGGSFPAMSCWRECLETMYGDYMALPPERERQNHSIEAWRI